MILLAEDGTIQLWELNGSKLERQRTTDYFAKEKSSGTLKTPTTFEICLKSSTILVGTQSGNIHTLNLDTLELLEQVVYQDVVLQNVPAEHKKSSQGSVEVIAQHPTSDNILIGYQRGLIALWNNSSLSAESFYAASQQLESLSWQPSGDAFVTSHNDGSIINWKLSDKITPSEQPRIPYGPFPCKAVTKVVSRFMKNNEQLLVFSGGMPRASYGDKFTVTICEGEFEAGKHHVLDFSSKVIDFEIIDELAPEGTESVKPKAVVVLLEEEIVAIDLSSPEWLQFKLPYLSSVHSSGITSSTFYSDVPEQIFKNILEVGDKQNSGKYSSQPWPITGGAVGQEESVIAKTNDLLVTGHEDGSICLWNASDVALSLILSVQTRKFFMATDSDIAAIDGDDEAQDAPEDPSNEWPPFRKSGTFDPYSDDVRLAIRNVVFCPKSGHFMAAGTAGQVVSFKLSGYQVEKTVPVITSSIVDDSSGFVWKGHERLHLKNGVLKFEPGLIPDLVVQLTPPAAITALTFNSDWNLLSAGSAHGFVLVDLITSKVLLAKSTLSAADVAASADGNVLITRRKSFKKSLRESFRRLRKGRTSLRKKSSSPTPAPAPTLVKSGESEAGPSSPAKDTPTSSKVTSPVRSLARGPVTYEDESPRLERQIEAKGDDGLGSMVRTIYMAPANVTSANVVGPTLWVGTNAGTIYIHTIALPEKEKRSEVEVSAQLAKEIQLKHRAPVIYVQVIDSTGTPAPASLPEAPTVAEDAPPATPSLVEGGDAPVSAAVTSPVKTVAKTSAVNYRVLIVSEEQFKLFQLPSLKPDRKSKLTAHEGARARKVNISSFPSKSDDNHVEHCLSCLSNQGDVSIYDLADLKRQASSNLIKKEDVHGIASLLFTSASEGLFLHSPSEFQRFSLSVRRVLLPTGIVEIPEGVRPVVIEPVSVTTLATPVNPEPTESKEVEKVVEEREADHVSIVEPESVAAEVAEAALTPVIDGVAPVDVEPVEPVLEPFTLSTPEIDSVVPALGEPENNLDSIVHHEHGNFAESDVPSLILQQGIVNDASIPTNGHHNGVNGVDGEGLHDGVNGTNGSSPFNDTGISYATNDITIDSVRDFA